MRSQWDDRSGLRWHCRDIGLLLLAARLLKRFFPGAHGAAGLHGFSVIQRIPLGQRQSIAVVQHGDTLIGLSVGDGGVRMLFTLPERATQGPLDASIIRDTEHPPSIRTATTAVLPSRAATPAAIAYDRQVTPTVPLIVDLPAAPRDPFRTALRVAMRSSTVLALLLIVRETSHAQTAAPVSPPRATTVAPQATTPLRTLPPAAAQPGPRDLPVRADIQVPAPRLAKPTATAARGGGVAELAPLVSAAQAQTIAVGKQRNAGTAPLTTSEAQRMAQRADSMLTRLAPQLDLTVGGGGGAGEGLRLSGTVGVVVMMGLLSLLPMLLLMMTGFTRILIVLHFLKQALGTQTTPPGQLVAAMALLLSGFVMAPTLTEVHKSALEPWMDGQIQQVEMMSRAVQPFKGFMLRQVRDQDLQTFVDLADAPAPATRDEVALPILMSAFVTSELRTAFQIGFALFLPFIVIDVVVSSVLMSMGMVMLPPALISMPFKLLLFVLVDGWGLVITGLVQSFR
jgi:flagellar biosynthesis protein FliP